MVSALDRAEKILQPNKRDDAWRQFRFEILNLGNDKVRQLSDKLDDYEIEFRPQIVFGVKYIGEDDRADIEKKVTQFDFYFYKEQPGIRIQLPKTLENTQTLTTLRDSIRCGFVINAEGKETCWWESYGLAEIFSQVIPFFDKNQCFKGKALSQYNEWKEKVYALEAQGVGNVG
jgi:hypothetical protein